jgi:hypothetical protein
VGNRAAFLPSRLDAHGARRGAGAEEFPASVDASFQAVRNVGLPALGSARLGGIRPLHALPRVEEPLHDAGLGVALGKITVAAEHG